MTARKRTRSCLLCDAGSRAMPPCALCDAGFRRVGGIHVGSQRLGMIPDKPCARVYAALVDGATLYERRFMAYVDGEELRNQKGEVRRFATATAAVNAARRAAPRKWHE